MTKGGLSKHFNSCSKRREIISSTDQKSGRTDTLYHLQVQDAWNKDYWLHLEMRGSASLADLDSYLRSIWLECCGHLSRFSVGGWGGHEFPMSNKVNQVFQPGIAVTHIYDYGTSSETLVKVMDVRQGKATTNQPIALMARNKMPEFQCMECDKTAEWLCSECVIEEDESGLLCDEHAETHPHENYGGRLPLVNSPRVGMCGYEGPAEPPY
jgi:hypothetical protein